MTFTEFGKKISNFLALSSHARVWLSANLCGVHLAEIIRILKIHSKCVDGPIFSDGNYMYIHACS